MRRRNNWSSFTIIFILMQKFESILVKILKIVNVNMLVYLKVLEPLSISLQSKVSEIKM